MFTKALFFFVINTALTYGIIETLFLGKRAISVWSLKISKYSFVKFLAKRGRARNGRSDAWPPFVISSNVSLPRENKIIQGFDWFWLRRNKICRHKNDLFSLPFPMGHRLVHSELGGALLIVITSSTTFSCYQRLYNMQKLSILTPTSRAWILRQWQFSNALLWGSALTSSIPKELPPTRVGSCVDDGVMA